jgi:hypothetical protein
MTQLGALQALCLACEPSGIQEYAQRAMKAMAPESLAMYDPFDCAAGVAFFAGELTESQLLARSDEQAQSRHIAHFNLAMKGIAMKNRATAVDNFRKCVETGPIGGMATVWARAYLTRMDADPTWPSWMQNNAAK